MVSTTHLPRWATAILSSFVMRAFRFRLRSAGSISLMVADIPDLETVLTAISTDFITEKYGYAKEMAKNNPLLQQKVDRIFAGAELVTFPHHEILTELATKAKFIVRTGAFDPWGNILLYSGVEVTKWFSKPGTVVPDYYASRMK